MNRKTFLATAGRFAITACAVGGASLLACASESDLDTVEAQNGGGSTGGKDGFVAKRQLHEYTGVISAPPERVFPLLCPVREYEWLDGWRCRVIYSESGVAEDNCVFETNHKEGPMTWVVSRYEPPRRIEFVTFVPGRLTERLSIALEAAGSGTKIRWTRKFTGLSEQGNQGLSYWQTDWDRALTDKLEYFLANGRMLRNG